MPRLSAKLITIEGKARLLYQRQERGVRSLIVTFSKSIIIVIIIIIIIIIIVIIIIIIEGKASCTSAMSEA